VLQRGDHPTSALRPVAGRVARGGRRRRVVAALAVAIGATAFPSAASAQLVRVNKDHDHVYKVGQVTCVVDWVGASIYRLEKTQCSVVHKNKSAFCGPRDRTNVDYDFERYCEIKIGADKRVYCGDHVYESYTGWRYWEFTGCQITVRGAEVDCGRTSSYALGQGSFGNYDSSSRTGCDVSSGDGSAEASCRDESHHYSYDWGDDRSDTTTCGAAVASGARSAGASCAEYENSTSEWPYYEHGRRCIIGPMSLDCLYDYRRSPALDVDQEVEPLKTCRLSIPDVLTCDISVADPAGSLAGCLAGAAARRRG
jgi:hypothetical protein